MSSARSIRALCCAIGLMVIFGGALQGCGGSSGENEVITPPQPRQGRDSMDAYKADMKKKPVKSPR